MSVQLRDQASSRPNAHRYAGADETGALHSSGPQAFLPAQSGAAANGLPIYNWSQAAAQITRDNVHWNATIGTAVTVTYAFRSTEPSTMPSDTSGFSRFTAAQIQYTEEALRLWSEVSNITFMRVGTGSGDAAYSNNATILFSNYSSGQDAAAAFAYFPGSALASNQDGDVWVNFSLAENANITPGAYGQQVLAHEIGHAIGLSHPGDYNAGEGSDPITYENDAVFYQDSRMYTIMSYFGSNNAGGSLNAFAAGPQLFDIAAAQRLYGANMTTRTGDTIYGFHSNTGHASMTITADGQSPVFAIWDAGGNDTLDLSGYSTASEIDLRQEAFSSAGPGNGGVGVAVGNISIARGAVIENGIGGSGADTMIGNSVANNLQGNAGADNISGGDGDDTISGGAGGDTIDGGNGNDTLYGFGAGASGAIVTSVAASGINVPVAATSIPSDPGKLYVVEKDTGVIWRLDPGTGQRTVFLDIDQSAFATGDERGVLGLAFHPDYATNGRFFVFMTDPQGDLQVREYHRSSGNPNVADAASTLVIEIPHSQFANHNGGWIGFSPTDGYLYISTGDGGSGGDPNNNAQNLNSLLGKILRVDVNNGDAFPADATHNYAIPASNPFVGVAGADEIWAYGLRNPWRIAFDPRNGDLYIADVGQSAREEVDYHAVGAAAGANYGWRIMEGTLPYNPGPAGTPQPGDPSLVSPIFDYGRTVGTTVAGGEVYVGASAGFVGQYVFADFGSDRLFSLSVVNGHAVDAIDRTSQIVGPALDFVTDFVSGTDGALYALGLFGTIWRVDFAPGAEDGNDTINGGAGNDIINGGAGADILSGDAGNDVIYWDVADTSVNGGADTDILVFTSGAAPTTFDLVAHGFESAENRQTDTGANAWATQTIYYDTGWRTDRIIVINDDGTRADLDYDQLNQSNFATNFNLYTATGAQDINVVVYDTNYTASLDFDQGNAFNWTTNWNQYDPTNALDLNVTVYDTGITAAYDYDQASVFDWTSNWNQYDASNALDINVTVYDSGVTASNDFDQAGAFDWTTNWVRYDNAGRLDLNVVVYDNGNTAVLDYDQAGQFAWATIWQLYDSAGNLIGYQGINDDGSTFGH